MVVGTTAITFSVIGFVLNAGTGLTRSGNTIALTAPVAVALGGTNATTAAGARANLGTPTLYTATFGDGASSTFTITHSLGNAHPHVVVYDASGNVEDCAVQATNANTVVLTSEA